MTVRIGIVGCGFIGFIHSYALHLLTEHGVVDAAVVATFDTDPERAASFAAVHGAVVCTDVDDLVDRVDAVWVCTWTAAHLDVVAAAVAGQRAVFCEKPLAPTLPECERVAALLDTVPHQVGLVLRSAPVFEALAEHLHGGRHGRTLAVVFRDDQFFPTQGFYASEWRADVAQAGGGCLIEHSIHDVDILRFCFGEVDSVTARTANVAGHEGVEDVAAVTLSFASGLAAQLTSVWHDITTRGSTRRIEVFFRDGMVRLSDEFRGPLHIQTSAGKEVRKCPSPEWVDALPLADDEIGLALRAYVEADRAFADAVVEGRPPKPNLAEALVAHRLVDASYRSAAEDGAPVVF